MHISFVIRTLNEAKCLPKTLNAIEAQKGNYNIEVVIVDSGSSDGTVEIARRHTLCKLLEISPSEWSWGKSLNLGLKNCSADTVVIISAHCFLSSDKFLINATKLLAKHNLAAVYGRQHPIKDIDPFEEYELDNWFPDIDFYSMDNDVIRSAKGIGVSHACCILRKSSWELVPYREDVQSMEDAYWAYDITKTSKTIAYSSQLGVFHSHALTADNTYRKWYWRHVEGRKLLNNLCTEVTKRSIIKRLKIHFHTYIKKTQRVFEYRNLSTFLKEYPFLTAEQMHSYMILRDAAIIAAYRDVHDNKVSGGYWELKLPLDMDVHIARIDKVAEQLANGFNKKVAARR